MTEPRSDGVHPDPATCYHEAGHVVIAYLKGMGASSVSGLPDSKSLGSTSRVSYDGINSNEIIVALAGPFAEKELTGEFNEQGASQDLEAVQYYASYLPPAYLIQLWSQTESLVENNWPAIVAVAEKLREVGSLEGKQVAKIIESAKSKGAE